MRDVVDVPHSAWYDPDEKGVDGGRCANVLTGNEYAPVEPLPIVQLWWRFRRHRTMQFGF